jgi:hypothetical protein
MDAEKWGQEHPDFRQKHGGKKMGGVIQLTAYIFASIFLPHPAHISACDTSASRSAVPMLKCRRARARFCSCRATQHWRSGSPHWRAELKSLCIKDGKKKDWRRTLGMFAGDQLMKQINAEGRRIRLADRKADFASAHAREKA